MSIIHKRTFLAIQMSVIFTIPYKLKNVLKYSYMVLKKRKTTKATRSKKKDSIINKEPSIKEETLRGVWGVLALAFAALFLLAGFGVAGVFGTKIYEWLGMLFGIGYWLAPLSLLLLSLAFFKSFEHKVGALKVVGAGMFFLISLALIETLFTASGGMLGNLLSSPLVWALDTVATVVVLLSLLVASLLVVFDTHPTLAFPSVHKLFKKNGEDEELDKDHLLKDSEEDLIDKETNKMSDSESQKDIENQKDTNQEKDTQKKTSNIIDFAKNKGGDLMDTISLNGQTHGEYILPPLSILQKDKGKPSVGDVKAGANSIKRTLLNFGVHVEMDEVSIGPTVTRYALKPAEGVRLAKIVSLQSNLELALAASPIRIEAPIPGRALVGIEVPNTSKSLIGLASLIGHADFQHSEKSLLVTLGRDITGKPHYANIAKMPHLLIAGTTGAGKSVTIHDLVVSLLYRNSPQSMRLLMVDPKRVELTQYNGIPHLLTPVITDPKKAILALKWLAKEMERRYDILETESVRDIASYHENVYDKRKDDEENKPEPMPYIVAFLDELADLMQAYPREMEAAIVRLAQMSRAVGIHLVLSTQRPSVKVITGLIKANIPARIALQVASQIDSRTILDMGGAEKLLGAGDMLYLSGDMSKPMRIQAPYITEGEVKKVVAHIVKTYESEIGDEIDLDSTEKDALIFSSTVADDGDEEDELFEEARQTVIEAGKASTSYLQRKLRVGYARAARLMDILEERGIIGEADGSKPREILVAGNEDAEEDVYTEEDNTQDQVTYEEENDTQDKF